MHKKGEHFIGSLERSIQELEEESNENWNHIHEIKDQHKSLLMETEESEHEYLKTIQQQEQIVQILQN